MPRYTAQNARTAISVMQEFQLLPKYQVVIIVPLALVNIVHVQLATSVLKAQQCQLNAQEELTAP